MKKQQITKILIDGNDITFYFGTNEPFSVDEFDTDSETYDILNEVCDAIDSANEKLKSA